VVQSTAVSVVAGRNNVVLDSVLEGVEPSELALELGIGEIGKFIDSDFVRLRCVGIVVLDESKIVLEDGVTHGNLMRMVDFLVGGHEFLPDGLFELLNFS